MKHFFADEHFATKAGEVIWNLLPQRDEIIFHDVATAAGMSELESGEWERDCDLLILHMIAETCGVAHAGAGAEEAVKRYCQSGRPLILLHGSSAAFWKWKWWRDLVGLRWVRPGDPDGVEPSTHPYAPCSVKSKVDFLQSFELPIADEIYIKLNQTTPMETFMETEVGGEVWPMCAMTRSPFANGRIYHFLPGHLPQHCSNPALIADISTLISKAAEE